MNQTPNGPDDEVREALAAAVGSYGPAVLGNAQMLGNILTDLLPDHPRERSLLVAASEAEAATLLQEQVGRQRLDAGTAVALTSRTLMERRALDPTAARWVTTAYATALGYNPPPVGPPPPVDAAPRDAVPGAPSEDRNPYVPTQPMSSLPPQPQPLPQAQPPGPSMPDAPTLIAPPGSGSFPPGGSLPPAGSSLPPAPPPPPGPPGSGGSGGYGSPAPAFGPPSFGAPSFGAPSVGAPSVGAPSVGAPSVGQSVPSQGFGPPSGGTFGGYAGPGAPGGLGGPGGPGGPRGPGKRPTTLILVASAVVVLLVAYLALAGASHLPPFQTAAAHPTHSVLPSPTPPSPSPSPTTPEPSPTQTGPVLDPGLSPLMDILSTALPDPATQCQAHSTSQDSFTSVGVVSAYYCTDTNLPGGGIWAYQMDTQADYQSTWVAYNKWWGFTASSAGSSCPPSGGSGEGLTPWHDDVAGYPYRTGQVVECQMVGSGSKADQPSYTWSLPTQNAFFIAEGDKGSSWSALNDWWAKYAPPQSTATPSPSTS